ncbi:hypothetical protein DPMN_061245 [Dreissena polymorpha]|uniref:CCHC-type domain-containing protein n=1 Tax=Dreissena polymorpha TaxID=45954 RepID=A0A9D4C7D3_DREPO|nr:hypothetical protein DPMN_061245 [Dreissena polymorpha]
MQQPKSIGEAIEKIRMFNQIQFACAPTQMTEQEESRWVHAVGEEPIPEVVSGSAIDKLTQVVEKLLDAVERLSNSFGSSGVNPYVRQLVQPFRNESCAEYPVEGPYPRKVRNRSFNDQRQDRYPVGSCGGGHRKQYACERPEGTKRGRYGSNWGRGQGMSRRDILCLNCGVVGHFQRACLENTKSVAKHNEVLSLERGGPQHVKDMSDAVPLVQPTVPDVVRDPGMVIGNITEGDHGDPVCVDAFRVQRVYGESAETASREAAEVAQGGEIGQAAREMARSATGDGAKPTAGHVDLADVAAADRRKCATGYGVAAGDHRGGGASGYRVAPDKRREDEFRRPVRRGLRGWRSSSSRRWERSQRWKLGWRPPERLTSKFCTA